MYNSLIINTSIFGALQSRCPGVTFVQSVLFSDYGAIGRQALPCYAQIPIDGFLAFLGLAGLTDAMRLSVTGWQHNGCVTMRSQDAFQRFPVSIVSFLFQCPQYIAQQMISQDTDKHVRLNTIFLLVRIGPQSQIALERFEPGLGLRETDIQLPKGNVPFVVKIK